ncbi:cell cycle checkpoint control protein RAD9A isoform X2 [Pseudophryne corroboree]|uniref:cell cycle checkpoint control protein RAD9A isoform X2 n=1 Tax=Pseudophryne corroboree TaxID=495146 RepID=UPI003081405B
MCCCAHSVPEICINPSHSRASHSWVRQIDGIELSTCAEGGESSPESQPIRAGLPPLLLLSPLVSLCVSLVSLLQSITGILSLSRLTSVCPASCLLTELQEEPPSSPSFSPQKFQSSCLQLVTEVLQKPITCHTKTVSLYKLCTIQTAVLMCSEPQPDPSKAMLTELSLSREEFLDFQLQKPSEITFCLREFRGLLGFAESTSLPISIHFDHAGCPAVFSVDDTVLEVHFVLATLSDTDNTSQSLSQRPCLPNDDDDFLGDDLDYMIAMETTLAGPSSPPRSPTFCSRPLPSPVQEEPAVYSGSEDEPELEVPGTPPNKKFRSLFFGSVLQNSGRTAEEVLAEDSDG